jgi:hypothetical protein
VKIRFFGKEVILVICFIFLFSALAFAQGKEMQIKGKVMQLDFAKKMVIVNEKTFFWNQNTLFYDEKGSPVSITEDRLIKGTLVSIKTTWIKNKPYIIKKLSLVGK